MKLKILHIVPWFPHPENEIEGVFIARHIQSLKPHCDNEILHLRFANSGKTEMREEFDGIPLARITCKPFLNKWKIKEWMAARIIDNYLSKHEHQFSVVNFYIAYPNAISIGKLKSKYPRLKFMISEQWSAYHENFSLPKTNYGRIRIESMFKFQIPLVVVSTALGEDIRKFSGLANLPFSVVPNSVNEKTFTFKPKGSDHYFTFCSINNWSAMKNPLLLIEAFHLLNQAYPDTRLILAGSGNLDEEIQQKIRDLDLENVITQKGRISTSEVVDLLHSSNVYCQSSNYETFSAICIEALATGTPVIATNIGGMKDFITPENGFLVDEMTPLSWKNALETTMLNYANFSLDEISRKCVNTYNQQKVGQTFYTQIAAVYDAE